MWLDFLNSPNCVCSAQQRASIKTALTVFSNTKLMEHLESKEEQNPPQTLSCHLQRQSSPGVTPLQGKEIPGQKVSEELPQQLKERLRSAEQFQLKVRLRSADCN